MKTWKQITNIYPGYLKDNIKVPKLRLSALAKIEHIFQTHYPIFLEGNYVFINIDKQELKRKYESLKGMKLNGAEDQVFNDFYKLSKLL